MALAPAVASPAVINKTPPTISGAFETGQKLTANRGTWTWDAKTKYQWYGPKHTPIPGATTKDLRIPDGVTAISLEVTGSMAGKTSTTAATKETPVKTGLNTVRPGPIRFLNGWFPREGPPAVGELLLRDKGTWSTYDLHYRWYRNGKPISGAWRDKYRLKAEDVGALITFGVTGIKEGYKARTTFSDPIGPVVPLRPKVAGVTPKILGTGLVGMPLTVDPGAWTPGTRFTYQWTITRTTADRSGYDIKSIGGATSASYVPTDSDDGEAIGVDVTGWKDGYTPLLVSKRYNGAVLAPTIVPVHKAIVAPPTLVGTFVVGNTVTATPWRSGAVLTYQWKRNGVSIPGATGQSYKLRDADLGTGVKGHGDRGTGGIPDRFGHFRSGSRSRELADVRRKAAVTLSGRPFLRQPPPESGPR